MDALIFAGLCAAVLGLFVRRRGRVFIGIWLVVLAATIGLMAHHITSGLGLGLSW